MYTDKDKKSARIRFTCLCPACLCLGRQGRQVCVYPCAIYACFGKSLSSYHLSLVIPVQRGARHCLNGA